MAAIKHVSRVSRNAPFLPSKQAHALSPLGANFHPPFFLLLWVWFNPKRVWVTQKNGEIWIWSHISVLMHGYNPLFGRKWRKSSPRRTQRTPSPFFWCRSVLYVLSYYPEPLKVRKIMRFVLGTKFGWEWCV